MLAKFFDIFGGNREYPKKRNADSVFSSVSAETEVDIIRHYLEKKFNRKFRIRVKVEGYLDGEMEYRLVLDDRTDGGLRNCHSVWGASSKNVFETKRAFVDSYWHNVKRGFDALSKNDLDNWDSQVAANYRETAVAGSREEMFLRATAEGII